jgi:hypothetical protein
MILGNGGQLGSHILLNSFFWKGEYCLWSKVLVEGSVLGAEKRNFESDNLNRHLNPGWSTKLHKIYAGFYPLVAKNNMEEYQNYHRTKSIERDGSW